MDDNVVDRGAMVVIPLNARGTRVPDLDSTILRARHHPLPFAVKTYARDVPIVTLERQHGRWVCGLDVEELDRVSPGRGEEALVRGDAQAIHLRVWVLDRPGADPRERFPEAAGLLVTLRGQLEGRVGRSVRGSSPDSVVISR